MGIVEQLLLLEMNYRQLRNEAQAPKSIGLGSIWKDFSSF
jgi:hypothetical protein